MKAVGEGAGIIKRKERRQSSDCLVVKKGIMMIATSVLATIVLGVVVGIMVVSKKRSARNE